MRGGCPLFVLSRLLNSPWPLRGPEIQKPPDACKRRYRCVEQAVWCPRVLRKLAHKYGDVQKRSRAAQVTQVPLVRGAAQASDIWFEIERRTVDVANANRRVAYSKRVDNPRWH